MKACGAVSTLPTSGCMASLINQEGGGGTRAGGGWKINLNEEEDREATRAGIILFYE